MTPGQSRAARSLLGWSQRDLAAKAGVSVTTVRNFEREATGLMAQNERALQRALEAAGVVFLDEPYREGVALKPARRRARKPRSK
jgi:transcriptional regulator with XRE-family HTH domain